MALHTHAPDPAARMAIQNSLDLFGKHPEDVIGPIQWGAEALQWVSDVSVVIADEAARNGGADTPRIRRLANLCAHLGETFADTVGYEHETMLKRLQEAHVSPAQGETP